MHFKQRFSRFVTQIAHKKVRRKATHTLPRTGSRWGFFHGLPPTGPVRFRSPTFGQVRARNPVNSGIDLSSTIKANTSHHIFHLAFSTGAAQKRSSSLEKSPPLSALCSNSPTDCPSGSEAENSAAKFSESGERAERMCRRWPVTAPKQNKARAERVKATAVSWRRRKFIPEIGLFTILVELSGADSTWGCPVGVGIER